MRHTRSPGPVYSGSVYPNAGMGIQADGTQRLSTHRPYSHDESVLSDRLNTLHYSRQKGALGEEPDELTNSLYYATGVLPQPKPFAFQTKRMRIDWRALVGVDVDAVVRNQLALVN